LTGVELFWTWVAGFLTLCIFSFLYKDNPFYKLAEHVYVGVSAGYTIAQQYNQVLKPLLFENLWRAGHTLSVGEGFQVKYWLYVMPAILGCLLIARLVPRWGWISRWPIAFIVGMGAGYWIVNTMDANIMAQIGATIVPLWHNADWTTTLQNWLILTGVLTGLVYFYFSVEHKGVVMGTASRVGIWILMITFGSAFGYTVMARVSLLIGRFNFILFDWMQGTWRYFHG
jgi:hypothetical protein